MKHSLLFLIIFSILLKIPAQESWKKAKEKDGILIYTRISAENGLKEFRAHIEIEASIHSLAAIITTGTNYPNWVYKISSTRRLKGKIPDKTWTYYTVSMPWPLSDRDGIGLTSIKEAKAGKVVIQQLSAPDFIPEEKDYVRLLKTETTWTLEEGADGKVKVSYQMLADPGGVPAWIVNIFLLDGPMETLKGLRKEAEKAEFKNLSLDWVK